MASEDDIAVLLSEPTNLPEPSIHDDTSELADVFSSVFDEAIRAGGEALMLSPEEAEWVESCLVASDDLSVGSLDALQMALLDTLTFEQQEVMSSTDNLFLEVDEVFVKDGSGTNGYSFPRDVDMMRDEEASSEDDESVHGDADREANHENPILRDGCLLDEASTDSWTALAAFSDGDESPESVFKVWDLEIPSFDDDDELTKKLQELMKEDSLPIHPLPLELPAPSVEIDELVANLNDLSLEPFDDK